MFTQHEYRILISMKKKAGILNCIWAAFATFSRIPVPEADWNDENLRWQICCFPLVGVMVGILWCAAAVLMVCTGLHPVLAGAALTVLPLLLTGGIHMDGFLDTSDAVHSWKPREERLKILDDPHIGAFAVIYGAIYLILYFGLAVQLAASMAGRFAEGGGTLLSACTPVFLIVPGFVICRIFSGLSVVCFPKAKENGMVKSTADASGRRAAGVLKAELVLAVILYIVMGILLHRYEAVLMPAAAALVFVYYYRMTMDKFGGVSGDPAGWFLQVCELVLLAAAAVSTLMQL